MTRNGLNPITRLARDLLDAERLPSPMRERATLASFPYIPVQRSLLAPNYASDLGVRASDDPKRYLDAVAVAVGINVDEYLNDATPESMHRSIARGNPLWKGAEAHLDAAINFAGQWDLAARVAPMIIEEAEKHGGSALTYAASALSGVGDDRAGEAFELSSRYATGPFLWSMALIRKAAWLIKRADDLEAGEAVLDARADAINELTEEHQISRGDSDVMLGVGENLRGLVWTKRRDGVRARAAIEEAKEKLSATGLQRVGEDERNRYLAQAGVNLIQLEAMSGDVSTAHRMAQQHMEWALDDDRGSGTEAMILCGYIAFQAKELAQALDLVQQAERIVCRDGAVTQVTSTRKLLIAIHHERGENEMAQAVYESLQDDPVGLKAWIEGEDW